ncbi:MAG: hypothetical protein PQJ58_11475 [Spirochaetales bacterium]|nr:hypothetical protein [Spirochaetales bacterium]
MDLRIHHLFDMIRDYGAGTKPHPHPYGHSYHLMAAKLYENGLDDIRLVLSCDAVCAGCSKMKNGHCMDTITHRRDFTLKEEFNNHIDKRIMDIMNLQIETPCRVSDILMKADLYLNRIHWIYEGNDPEHTEMRKKHVSTGLIKIKTILEK